MWGLVLSCFAAVENYSGALAIRFFLGVFESAVTPGFALFTSQWYTKKEQGARTGIWFSFNGWAQVRISQLCTCSEGVRLMVVVDLWRMPRIWYCCWLSEIRDVD
jgi:MFS family permease